MIVLLDMDEVLVNFIDGACKAHGITKEQMEHYRPHNEWSLIDPIGRAKTAGMSSLTLDEFWEPIHKADTEFWENLEKLPWFEDVIAWAEERFEEWYIVSSPSQESCSYTGKVNWLKRELGSQFDRFFLTPHKEMLANPQRVLVDDRIQNLDRFQSHGGEVVLFPTKGGPLYHLQHDPMSYLKQYIGHD